jgi:hypothetical protein
MLDFEVIKKIRVVEVCGRYGIQLRYRGDFATAVCKLPTHKPRDKGRTFSVNVAENYWRCFSDSCNAKNSGRKGGDVINLVALLEKCSEYQAAEKLAAWYGLDNKKAVGSSGTKPERSNGVVVQSQVTTSSKNGKPQRFMQTIDDWFDALVVRGDQEIDDAAYWKRIKNAFKSRLIQNWKDGVKAGKEGKT